MALEHISGKVWIRRGPVNQGVIVHASGFCTVIDPGLDESTGRKLLRDLQKAGWQPSRLFVTHAHADHSGACAFLAGKTGAEVWAPVAEAGFMLCPHLEPFAFFGAAAPPEELRGKFLQPPASSVECLVQGGTKTAEDLTFVDLPGHSPGQQGVITPEGVFFTGDAFFGLEALKRHKIPYFADVSASISTFDRLQAEKGIHHWIPAHGPPVTSIQEILAANRRRLEEISQWAWKYLQEHGPSTREELAATAALEWDVALNAVQYHLLLGAIGAHLSHLRAQGWAEFRFHRGRMEWNASA